MEIWRWMARVEFMSDRQRVVIVAAALLLLAGCAADEGEEAGVTTGVPPTVGESAEREAAAQVLDDAGYLDDEGNVAFGPAGPSSEETDVQEALCTHLFGSPEEVAERAGLDGAVLAAGSGYQMLGANGSGVRCGWGAQDEPSFALVVWGDDADWITQDAAEFEVSVERPDGSVGVAAYDPASEIERLSAEELEAWLLQAPGLSQSV